VTHTEDFQVVITECVPTITGQPTISDLTWTIHTPNVSTPAFADYSQTPTACAFGFTYTAEHDLGASTTGLPSFITFDSSAKTFTVGPAADGNEGTYLVRVLATLDNVAATEDNTVTFTITINNNCKNDEVTLTAGTEIADDTFYIETPALTSTYSATFTHTYPLCPFVYSLKENTAAYSSAFITNFDTATGVITISTDSLTFDKVTKTLEVTATSTISTHTNGAASDSFDLTLKDECWDSVLTAPVLTANYPWDLYD